MLGEPFLGRALAFLKVPKLRCVQQGNWCLSLTLGMNWCMAVSMELFIVSHINTTQDC